MNRSTQLKAKQLGIIIVAWVLFGLFMTLYDYLVIHSGNSLGPAERYSFLEAAIQNVIAGLIAALVGGSFLVFVVNVKYQHKPYGYTVLAVGLSFLLIVFFISLIIGATTLSLQTGKPIYDPVAQRMLVRYLLNNTPIKSAIAWFLVVAVTQLLLQVSYKFGQDVFWHIIRGRYNLPKEEKRFFMFVDLNASTTIAEGLGDEMYHALLKDFFADVTRPILDNMGHIYQYVGDEVVISWSYQEGIDQASCIRCFFAMKDQIHQKRTQYLQRYGLIPTFKAGLHCGRVVAGEVGIIKRDITYSGDVLNTTSRIQGQCKVYNVDFIVSGDVLQQLLLSNEYQVYPLGTIRLRGKENELSINALQLLA